jgi:hypothetical protein
MDRIRIASPCSSSWEQMAGDERVRHCTACDLNVYNFAAMTRGEIGELLLRTEGRVCARLYRRADGTLLTKDCPTGLRAVRARLSRAASATFAALLSIVPFASGCATRSRMQLEVERTATAQQAVVAGEVLDPGGAPLPGVIVVLQDEAAQREITAVTDGNGKFAIGSLSEGLYRLEVKLSGFGSALVQHVPLRQSEITRAHVTLRFDATTETIVVGAIAVDPLAMNDGISTTFTKDFIDKLPF